MPEFEGWSKEKPVTPGAYWFIGDPFSDDEDDDRQTLNYVIARKISNGLLFVTAGNFMCSFRGWWKEVVLPELPFDVTLG